MEEKNFRIYFDTTLCLGDEEIETPILLCDPVTDEVFNITSNVIDFLKENKENRGQVHIISSWFVKVKNAPFHAFFVKLKEGTLEEVINGIKEEYRKIERGELLPKVELVHHNINSLYLEEMVFHQSDLIGSIEIGLGS